MADKKLHPSVQQFKMFVKENPNLIKEVRNGDATWQELYEEWYLLGEDDARWDTYRESNNKTQEDKAEESKTSSDWMGKIMNAVKNMDQDQLQGQIGNISQAIAAIQGVLGQFQGSQPPSNNSKSEAPQHPFSFRKD